MSREVNAICGRLSLREPQRESLARLARICEVMPPAKEVDLATALRVISEEFPSVKDFERSFPSLCFALATGVGKTRLMGAFIAYLYLTKRSRHFFVLAPNLTIYNKLIADFTPGSPKYVFQGISEFATAPPIVITGENYESGLGVRQDKAKQPGLFRVGGEDAIHVNVFNISKINSDVRASQKGNQPPRIKRLAEYIGESYFDYLAGLPDLVLLMDEAHRYRADAGMKAINELRPILGLELTATPFIESAKGPVWFKNTTYSYSLAEAIKDGFVKEPAVATRKNFKAKDYGDEQIDRIKLEDGVRLHEQVKTDLRIYASEHDRPVVKPFLLVIARDTTHAEQLMELIKSASFFEGRYAERVIEVHSAQTGEEKEETVERLLRVEQPDEPTEIVIHVNMLKEGWDVTNLYTIVPLRAANARTLIEQSIGRGLRLPFGKRTGVKAVDRLTIVAHDKFQEIVDEANREESVIRRIDQIILDPDGPPEAPRPVEVPSLVALVLSGEVPAAEVPLLTPASAPTTPASPGTKPTATPTPAKPRPTFTSPGEKAVAATTLQVISKMGHLPSASALLSPPEQKKIVEAVQLSMPQQTDLVYASVPELVLTACETYVALSIDIPTITVVPKGEVTMWFEDFDLDIADVRLQPVTQEILIQHLQSNQQEHIAALGGGVEEARLEDYVVSALLSFDDVDYDTNADLLYKLAGQFVEHLRSYLPDDVAVRNVLVYYQNRIGQLIHARMEKHRREESAGYEVKVTEGFRPLRSTIPMFSGEVRNFRVPVDDKRSISKLTFAGFRRCLLKWQKFQSDPERRFAVIADRDGLKWVKPARGSFPVTLPDGSNYEPDFVVEAPDVIYLVEVKRRDEVEKPEVVEKAKAAITWCKNATDYAAKNGGKPWKYVLVPDDVIEENMSLEWLAGQFGKGPETAHRPMQP